MKEFLHRTPEVFLDPDPHPNDVSCYKEVGKRLGVLDVDDVELGFIAKVSDNLTIFPSDPVISLHVPPLDRGKASPFQVADSMRLLAEYIERHCPENRYIVGITYERMWSASRRSGFHVASSPVPKDVREAVAKAYRLYAKQHLVKGPMGEIKLIYQTRDEFLSRFGKVA